MKTLFAVAAVLLLSISLLSAFLPGAGLAAEGNVTVKEMAAIKKAADEALATAKLLVEKAKTEEEKSLAEELLEYAAVNAEAAADLLKTVQEGGSVDRETAEHCAAVAKTVHKAVAAIAAGDAKKAGEVMDGIAEMEDGMPTAANAMTTQRTNHAPEVPNCCAGIDGRHESDCRPCTVCNGRHTGPRCPPPPPPPPSPASSEKPPPCSRVSAMLPAKFHPVAEWLHRKMFKQLARH